MFKIITLMSLLFSSSVVANAADKLWEQQGFETPESTLFLKETNNIVVSNINGGPVDPNGKGYLSLLSSKGKILQKQWASGLDAPKGMAKIGGTILVSDINKLRIIDIKTGKLSNSITLDGAVFLNDVTSNGEIAWITDLMTHSIWQYKDGQATLWLKDEKLSHPNGILFDGNRLLVGSWGKGVKKDLSTEAPGDLLSVDIKTKAISVVSTAVGNIDGIVKVGDKIIVNDWITGQIFEINSSGEKELLIQSRMGTADISAHEGTLYLPLMLDGKLEAVKLGH